MNSTNSVFISQLTRFLNFFVATAFCALLLACGGSGGSDDPLTSGSSSFSFSKSEQYVDVIESDTSIKNTDVSINISESIKTKVLNGSKIYVRLTQTNQDIAWLNYSFDGTIANLTIQSNFDRALSLGTYSTQITLILCWDSNCNNQIGKDTLDFYFGRHEKADLSASIIELSHMKGNQESAQNLHIDFKTMTVLENDWSIEVLYDDETNWLASTKTSNTKSGIVVLSGLDTACGTYKAQININYRSIGGIQDSLTAYVNYFVDSYTPQITEIYPTIQYKQKPMQMQLTGCGFDYLTDENIQLDSFNVTAFNRQDSHHLEIFTDPANESGNFPIKWLNTIEDVESPFVVVKSPLTFNYQNIDIDNLNSSGAEDKGLYDYTNDVLYLSTDYGWLAFHNDNDHWKKKSEFNFREVKDIDISKDGKLLYIVKNRELMIVDAITYQIISRHTSTIKDLTSVNVLSNNNLLVGRATQGFDRDIGYFNTNNNLFSLKPIEKGYLPISTSSLDKSKNYIATTHYPAFYSYDTKSDNIVKIFDDYVNIYRSAFSQNGKLSILFNLGNVQTLSVRNELFEEKGTIPSRIENPEATNPDFAQSSTLSKDGNFAFILYRAFTSYAYTYVLKFDLRNLALGGEAIMMKRFDMPDNASGEKLFLSGDENTIFIYGSRRLIVLPVGEQDF